MGLLLFIGAPEIMVILVFVLLFFGSKQIPSFARMLGKGMREFRRATEEIKREINEETQELTKEVDEVKKKLKS